MDTHTQTHRTTTVTFAAHARRGLIMGSLRGFNIQRELLATVCTMDGAFMGWIVGLDTLRFYFCQLFYSIMLSSHTYNMLLKWTYYSQIMLKNFSYTDKTSHFLLYWTMTLALLVAMSFHRVCGTNVVRSCSNKCLPYTNRWHHETPDHMRTHPLNGGPRVIIMFSRGEGFKASLLFSLVYRFLPIIPA